MASLHQHPKSSNYSLAFRYGGKQFNKSLRTSDRREADRIKARVEQAIIDLERGRHTLPDGAELWPFLLSDGKLAAKPTAPAKAVTLSALREAYGASQCGQKEDSTLSTEDVHFGHLSRHFGSDKRVKTFTPADVAGYVAARAAVGINPLTIQKEVATLRLLCYRAERLTGQAPADVRQLFAGVEYPKTADALPFLTWGEVEATIARTKPDAAGVEALWDRVFLTTGEVGEFLGWAAAQPVRPTDAYFVPFLTAAAHTGMRRSELMRSEVGDWDFQNGVVTVREKKKSRKGMTYRRVTLTPRLAAVMAGWLDGPNHPGGALAFCRQPDAPLKPNEVAKKWTGFTRRSKWAVLRGYHVLRHSFASNLALAGVDERVVDQLLGHETEAMRRRYRHLFPDQRADAVARLFA